MAPPDAVIFPSTAHPIYEGETGQLKRCTHIRQQAAVYLATQLVDYWYLEDMKEDDQRKYRLAESALAHASKTGDPWEEELRAHFKQLDDLK